MPIYFVPNDPRATKFQQPKKITPTPARRGNVANFQFGNLSPRNLYPTNTVSFLEWQVREAALRTMAAFEAMDGRKLQRWARAGNPRMLDVHYIAGFDINAYYNGNDLGFFQTPVDNNAFEFTGASTDVVSHEVGHAILDALRPDLWDITFLEVAAFHEAFGDCIALLTTLHDPAMRKDLASGTTLGRRNFAETWGEHLSWLAGAEPRQARNNVKWHLPTSQDEEHDFSVIFTGCIYDMIAAHFRASKNKSSADLLTSATTIAKLLFRATRAAQAVPRFFHAVGRAMVLDAGQDRKLRDIIKKAFDNHGIALGAAALTVPKSRLAGSAVRSSPLSINLDADALQDLRGRLRAGSHSDARVRQVRFGSELMAETTFSRQVNMGALPAIPNRTFVPSPETVLVGNIGAGATRMAGLAVMSALPDRAAIDQEHADYLIGLTQRGKIQHAGRVLGAVSVGVAARTAMGRRMSARDAATFAQSGVAPGITHIIAKDATGEKQTVQRVRFACRCGHGHAQGRST
jgi:hypothetical protein